MWTALKSSFANNERFYWILYSNLYITGRAINQDSVLSSAEETRMPRGQKLCELRRILGSKSLTIPSFWRFAVKANFIQERFTDTSKGLDNFPLEHCALNLELIFFRKLDRKQNYRFRQYKKSFFTGKCFSEWLKKLISEFFQ